MASKCHVNIFYAYMFGRLYLSLCIFFYTAQVFYADKSLIYVCK